MEKEKQEKIEKEACRKKSRKREEAGMKKNGRTLGKDIKIVRRGIRELNSLFARGDTEGRGNKHRLGQPQKQVPWGCLSGHMAHVLVRSLLVAVMPFATAAVTAGILDRLMEGQKEERLVMACMLGVGLLFACSIWKNYEDCRIAVGYRRLFDSSEISLTDKAYRLPYELLEAEETRRLRDEISGNIHLSGAGMASLYWDMDVLWTNLISAGIAIVISGYYGWRMIFQESRAGGISVGTAVLVPCLGLLVAFCVFLSCRMTGKRFDAAFGFFQKGAESARYGDYYHMQYLQDEDAAMDARIYQQEELIVRECQTKCYEHQARAKEEDYSAMNRYDGIKIGSSCICGCMVYLFVGYQAGRGLIGCGSIVMLYAAVTWMIDSMARTAEIVTDLRNNNVHLLRYFRFLDLPEEQGMDGEVAQEKDKKGKQKISKRDSRKIEGEAGQERIKEAGKRQGEKRERGIEIRDVTFQYPGSTAFALRHVCLRIDPGERIAIVGENGSGKTTLIKLLCRLYHPNEGQILVDGSNIQAYPYDQYMEYVSTVFQDYTLFAFTVAENVAGTQDYDEEKVCEALAKVGLLEKVKQYPKGIRQPLFHDFDLEGTDLSGGEAQKLAIARAIYRDTQIMILDEPTAALDPYAEYEIYESLRRAMEGRTMIFISHRLSSCRMCDRIVVMHQGEVVQCGTHEELLAHKNGKYHALWEAQAQYYV